MNKEKSPRICFIKTYRRLFSMKNYKNANTSRTKTLLVSSVLNLALILLTCAVSSAICYSTINPLAYAKLFSLATVIISGALCGFINSRRNGGSFCFSALSSALVGAIMIIASIFLENASLPAAAMNAFCYALTACGAALLGKPRTKKHKRRI